MQDSSSELPLEARLEAILFAAASPVSLSSLAEVLGVDRRAVEEAILFLQQSLAGRGVTIVQYDGVAEMTTAAEAAVDVRRFLHSEHEVALSPAALETLAIIAYKQPVTRSEIESVRGVNCGSVLRTLVRAGLVMEAGRLDQPGRPIAYETTAEFLKLFGLRSLADLPSIEAE